MLHDWDWESVPRDAQKAARKDLIKGVITFLIAGLTAGCLAIACIALLTSCATGTLANGAIAVEAAACVVAHAGQGAPDVLEVCGLGPDKLKVVESLFAATSAHDAKRARENADGGCK